MAIPALTSAGLLPPGIYDVTLAEIEYAFGSSNPRRAELFRKFTEFLAVARAFGLFQAVVTDGSFVTDKESPGDIDAVLLLPRADLPKLSAHPKREQIMDQHAIKARYEVHLFLDPLPSGAGQVFSNASNRTKRWPGGFHRPRNVAY